MSLRARLPLQWKYVFSFMAADTCVQLGHIMQHLAHAQDRWCLFRLAKNLMSCLLPCCLH